MKKLIMFIFFGIVVISLGFFAITSYNGKSRNKQNNLISKNDLVIINQAQNNQDQENQVSKAVFYKTDNPEYKK